MSNELLKRSRCRLTAGLGLLLTVTATQLTPAPAAAATSWTATDLIALTGAPAAAGDPFGYTNGLSGDGMKARVVYRTTGGHIVELSSGSGSWSVTDLTQLTGAPAAAGDPFGYTGRLKGQVTAMARVVYRTSDGHVEELSSSGGGSWRATDLTQGNGAPAAAGDPVGYIANPRGPGPMARVVYLTAAGHVEELRTTDRSWSATDLTELTVAAGAVGDVFAYSTYLTGMGEVARVLHRTGSGHLQELSLDSSGNWRAADLSQLAGAPVAVGAPFAYVTDLPGQGQVIRVLYQNSGRYVEELSSTDGRTWRATDLTRLSGAPNTSSRPVAYSIDVPGQGLQARVVHRTGNGHIEQLATGGGDSWSASDLSQLTGAPFADGEPAVFTTNLPGQGPRGRVVYRFGNGHLEELRLSDS